jgi:hypothetical protein
MAPVHEDFERSGMTEDDLNALVDDAVAETRAERQAARKQP